MVFHAGAMLAWPLGSGPPDSERILVQVARSCKLEILVFRNPAMYACLLSIQGTLWKFVFE